MTKKYEVFTANFAHNVTVHAEVFIIDEDVLKFFDDYGNIVAAFRFWDYFVRVSDGDTNANA